LIEKIHKDLQDPAIQQQILDQAILDVQRKWWVKECVASLVSNSNDFFCIVDVAKSH
jgi:hypothetical protein